MTVETLLKIGIVPSDEQLDCRHIVGVTTLENDVYFIYESTTHLFYKYGGIEFSYCPMCGMRLK